MKKEIKIKKIDSEREIIEIIDNPEELQTEELKIAIYALKAIQSIYQY